jgi:hypothetical protein
VDAQSKIKTGHGKKTVEVTLRADVEPVRLGQILKSADVVAMVTEPETFSKVGDLVRYRVISTAPTVLQYNEKLVALYAAEQVAFDVLGHTTATAIPIATAELIHAYGLLTTKSVPRIFAAVTGCDPKKADQPDGGG